MTRYHILYMTQMKEIFSHISLLNYVVDIFCPKKGMQGFDSGLAFQEKNQETSFSYKLIFTFYMENKAPLRPCSFFIYIRHKNKIYHDKSLILDIWGYWDYPYYCKK